MQLTVKKLTNVSGISYGNRDYEYFANEHNISRAQFRRYEKGQDLRFSSLIKVVMLSG